MFEDPDEKRLLGRGRFNQNHLAEQVRVIKRLGASGRQRQAGFAHLAVVVAADDDRPQPEALAARPRIAGAFVGGAMVVRWGPWKPLCAMVVLCGSCNLLYLLLIAFPGDAWMLTAVISAENFTLGMLGPPTVAFLSALVNREHTATQYALLSSLVNLPGKVLGSGALNLPVKVAALDFSEAAVSKITGANGTCMTIEDLVRDNPKGSRIRILR